MIFVAGVSTSLAIQDRMTSPINRIASAVAKTNRALQVTDTLSEQINPGQNFSRSVVPIENATQQVEKFNRRQNEVERTARGVKTAWGGMGTAIQAALAAFSLRQLLTLTDTMTQTTARLDLINDGLQTTEQLQNKISASANRSRASYTDTASVVSRLGILAKDAFTSNDEMIAFTELMNKNFVIGGASVQEQTSAMYQLTQAMAAGKLQGDEFRSIMENAPLLAQAIAAYTGKTTGELKEMSAEGTITADIIKGAMFSTIDEVNERFEKIPMTFAQVATIVQNTLLKAFGPVLKMIGAGAQWIYDNWSTIEPVFWGIVGAVGALVIIMGIWQIVTWAMTAAQWGLNAAIVASGIGAIVVIVGLIIFAIVKWIQSVGGLKVAWLITCNILLTAWDWVKVFFWASVFGIIDLWERMQLAFWTVTTNIVNFMGDMKVNVLMILQNMVNGAIDIINGFISLLNKIPGVNISLIDKVTFGTTAQLENEAAKQARNKDLADYQDQVNKSIADRQAKLNQMMSDAKTATAQRETEIKTAQAEAAKKKSEDNANLTDQFKNVDYVDQVGKVKGDINIAEEDLKFFRDVAEMRYTQNFVTLTPQVVLRGVNISEKVDVDEVVGRIETRLENEFTAAAEGVYQ